MLTFQVLQCYKLFFFNCLLFASIPGNVVIFLLVFCIIEYYGKEKWRLHFRGSLSSYWLSEWCVKQRNCMHVLLALGQAQIMFFDFCCSIHFKQMNEYINEGM